MGQEESVAAPPTPAPAREKNGKGSEAGQVHPPAAAAPASAPPPTPPEPVENGEPKKDNLSVSSESEAEPVVEPPRIFSPAVVGTGAVLAISLHLAPSKDVVVTATQTLMREQLLGPLFQSYKAITADWRHSVYYVVFSDAFDAVAAGLQAVQMLSAYSSTVSEEVALHPGVAAIVSGSQVAIHAATGRLFGATVDAARGMLNTSSSRAAVMVDRVTCKRLRGAERFEGIRPKRHKRSDDASDEKSKAKRTYALTGKFRGTYVPPGWEEGAVSEETPSLRSLAMRRANPRHAEELGALDTALRRFVRMAAVLAVAAPGTSGPWEAIFAVTDDIARKFGGTSVKLDQGAGDLCLFLFDDTDDAVMAGLEARYMLSGQQRDGSTGAHALPVIGLGIDAGGIMVDVIGGYVWGETTNLAAQLAAQTGGTGELAISQHVFSHVSPAPPYKLLQFTPCSDASTPWAYFAKGLYVPPVKTFRRQLKNADPTVCARAAARLAAFAGGIALGMEGAVSQVRWGTEFDVWGRPLRPPVTVPYPVRRTKNEIIELVNVCIGLTECDDVAQQRAGVYGLASLVSNGAYQIESLVNEAATKICACVREPEDLARSASRALARLINNFPALFGRVVLAHGPAFLASAFVRSDDRRFEAMGLAVMSALAATQRGREELNTLHVRAALGRLLPRAEGVLNLLSIDTPAGAPEATEGLAYEHKVVAKVKAWGTVKVPIDVPSACSLILYEVVVADKDVDISVIFEHPDGREQTVVPPYRSTGRDEGLLLAIAGKHTLVLSNAYSWVVEKTVEYRVAVLSPAQPPPATVQQ